MNEVVRKGIARPLRLWIRLYHGTQESEAHRFQVAARPPDLSGLDSLTEMAVVLCTGSEPHLVGTVVPDPTSLLTSQAHHPPPLHQTRNESPALIQKNTIPQFLNGDSDAFLQTETGLGKTLAYLFPIVQRIMSLIHDVDSNSLGTKIHCNSGLFAMILAPTRELCKQIATVLEKLLRCAPCTVSTSVIGGESKKLEKSPIRKGVTSSPHPGV
ncbi:hypothetical protein PG989_000336 [Apiospora arundinis]